MHHLDLSSANTHHPKNYCLVLHCVWAKLIIRLHLYCRNNTDWCFLKWVCRPSLLNRCDTRLYVVNILQTLGWQWVSGCNPSTKLGELSNHIHSQDGKCNNFGCNSIIIDHASLCNPCITCWNDCCVPSMEVVQ